MKHIVVNLATGQAGIYHTKQDISNLIGISVKTLNRKHIIDQIIRYKGYIICLNVPEYKATSKQRSTSF